ncbi:MAG: hypothetical protein ACREB9_01205 [Thermoplasmata archaeon]
MGNLRTAGNLFVEDITIGAGVAYVVGGIALTVTQAAEILAVHAVHVKSPSGTTAATMVLVAPVAGSESGQTFKLRAFQGGAAVSSLPAELPAASTDLEGLTVAVIYEAAA